MVAGMGGTLRSSSTSQSSAPMRRFELGPTTRGADMLGGKESFPWQRACW
jgi:hypothetical protein